MNRFDTQLVNSDRERDRFEGALSLPIFQNSTFEYGEITDYHNCVYGRQVNTPTHEIFHEKISRIEGFEAAQSTSSGMAAICSTILTFVKSGDRILAQECVYGGSREFFIEECPRFGVEVDFFDPQDFENFKSKIRPETKLVYLEAVSNPTIEVTDVELFTKYARTKSILSLVDNTYLSPACFRPSTHDADLVMHSATKYIGGHSDLMGGVISGSKNNMQLINRTINIYGGCSDPFAVFLMDRGLKTLGVRMRQISENALAVAKFLESCPEVSWVRYPLLPSHPQYDISKRLFSGGGGMIALELNEGREAARLFRDRLKIFTHAPSLGGVHSLVLLPAESTHSNLDSSEMQRMKISNKMLRLSIGLEDKEDLIEDIQSALA